MPDASYALSAASQALDQDVAKLRTELNKLDPIDSMMARFHLAEIEGVLQFMKDEVKKYE